MKRSAGRPKIRIGNTRKLPQLSDLKIDDKVMVRYDDDDGWMKRHFAGISENGKILAFYDGYTSWITTKKTEWNQWRLPTESEL